ncbi:MAG: hypothetical protein QOD98_3819 [Nocardioidaceae bacterium]|jgi:hypothetical protein|nr:hypothetical protein [Nocardioidaceae bacterium]
MRNTKSKNKTKVVVLATALVVIAGGAAFAYWTAGGSGTGTAATGTSSSVTVVQTSSISAMYPGEGTRALSGNFNNPNPGNTYVTAVTATGYTIDATHVTAGCIVSDGNYTLGGTSNTPGDVPAGNAKGAWSGLTIQMNNLGTNQDACKGATVTITYASS